MKFEFNHECAKLSSADYDMEDEMELFKDDIEKIVSFFDRSISAEDAYIAWKEYSHDFYAEWLSVPDGNLTFLFEYLKEV